MQRHDGRLYCVYEPPHYIQLLHNKNLDRSITRMLVYTHRAARKRGLTAAL